jgi:hypothetical protein
MATMSTKLCIEAIRDVAEKELCGISGILGFGIRDCSLRVYVRDAEAGRRLPRTFHGADVECVVTGDISARTQAR